LTDTRPFTALLARSIAVAAAGEAPTDAQYAAVRRILIDWLGVALAGTTEPVARILRAEYASEAGAASVLGGGRASTADAALINGTTGHALDYDDVQEFIGHPATVVVPAALAVAEAVDASGEQLARAIIAGYDAARFVGMLAMPGHYDHGFHSTATIGAFGAMAASAALMNLGSEDMENAIGLAATQAAGLKSMFGTMAKPFHAGRAASAGVVAARLAARGMTANRESLETDQGFLATQAHQAVPADWRAPRFGESLDHLLFKYHASCYLTHSSIEAVRQLARDHGLGPDDVAGIVLQVPAGHLKVCNIEEPATGLESKFSLRQVVAMTLSGHDTADIAVFNDTLAQDEGLRRLRGRISVQSDVDGAFGARVALTRVNGETLAAFCDVSEAEIGANDLDDRLDGKFSALAKPLIGSDRVHQILDLSYDIGAIDPAKLLACLRI
jgi:2-methylcitrate dehydratase PrpD